MDESFIIDLSDEAPSQDHLGFDRIIPRLVFVLSKAKLPLNVGIYGDWGSGKTTFLKHLNSTISKDPQFDNYFSVWFYPWKLSESANILLDLATAIYIEARKQGFTSSTSEVTFKELLKLIHQISFNINSITENVGEIKDKSSSILSTLIDKGWNAMLASSPYDYAVKRNELHSELSMSYNKFISSLVKIPIVYIDDLDRCSNESLVTLINGIKRHFSDSGREIIYLLALDNKISANAVSSYYRLHDQSDSNRYMDKMFNYIINIPRPRLSDYCYSIMTPFINDKTIYIKSFCATENMFYNAFFMCSLTNPRFVKKVIREWCIKVSYIENSSTTINDVVEVLMSAYRDITDARTTNIVLGRIILSYLILEYSYNEFYKDVISRYGDESLYYLTNIATRKDKSAYASYNLSYHLNDSLDLMIRSLFGKFMRDDTVNNSKVFEMTNLKPNANPIKKIVSNLVLV